MLKALFVEKLGGFRAPSLLISLGFCISTPPVLSAQAPMVDITPTAGTIAITGGKLLTVSHGVIENGVILIEGGKITAVGPAASVKAPKGDRKSVV